MDREFSRLLRAETAGNPFFIEQVLTACARPTFGD